MSCPFCNSIYTMNIKAYNTNPIGSKKTKCLKCNTIFIKHVEFPPNMFQINDIKNTTRITI